MKTVLKLLAGLLIGGLIGLVIGGGIAVLFTETTLTEFFHKFYTIDWREGLAVFLVAISATIVSFLILLPIHELGHLICGVLTGYKFVSFRIFNLTLIKKSGKFCIKKFAIAGTGGQCLLTPPDLPVGQVPVGWYNFGGLFANIIMLIIVIPLFFLDLNPFVAEALRIFIAVDAFMLLMNGIPVQVGGVGNDAYNMKLLRNNLRSKQAMVNQLRANALIQNGVRPKDMPDHLFDSALDIDYSNALEVTVALMYASRLIDKMEYEEALKYFEELYEHREKIMPLYVKEIACELAYLYLRDGKPEKAEALLDKDLRKYIEDYSKTMSSKKRLLCAMALYLDQDEAKALSIYHDLKNREQEYLLAGEVSGDLALIEDMLGQK